MNSFDGNKELESLVAQKEFYKQKIFCMMFEILFIFGVPALLGYFLSDFLKTKYEISKLFQIATLLPFFVLSWVILFFRFKNIDGQLRSVNQKINKLKADLSNN